MSIDAAIRLAKANPVVGLPRMAAIIMDRRRVISYELNSRKTHTLAARFQRNEGAFCLHAEIAALINARGQVNGMTIYVARVLKNDAPALAKPCFGCGRALTAYGIGDVFWTT